MSYIKRNNTNDNRRKEQELIDEFSDIDDWMDRYAYIIDMGNSLPALPDKLKTPDRPIEGCRAAYGSMPSLPKTVLWASEPIPTQ